MTYELFINNSSVLSGDFLLIILGFSATILLVAYLLKISWIRIQENEQLKYEFITIIAHKFRTPLTQMRWLLEANRETEQDPYKKENFEKVYGTNQKLINLTNTLIEITDSKNKSSSLYTFKKVNMCELLHKVTLGLKDLFHEKNIFYATDCSHQDIPVLIDESRMEFVLQTVIENAIKYSPVGRNIEILAILQKRKVIIQVIDHGIGARIEDVKKIFGKFYRSHDAQMMDTEGFGVGLFLARSIVKRHKGTIEAYSDGPNKGMTMTITLRRAR